jgi:hypothetical protein
LSGMFHFFDSFATKLQQIYSTRKGVWLFGLAKGILLVCIYFQIDKGFKFNCNAGDG